jgi:hypothetical protein
VALKHPFAEWMDAYQSCGVDKDSAHRTLKPLDGVEQLMSGAAVETASQLQVKAVPAPVGKNLKTVRHIMTSFPV